MRYAYPRHLLGQHSQPRRNYGANGYGEKVFSKAALDCAFFECGWYCFEEDCAAAVALRELMDKRLFTAPVNEYYAPGEYEKLIDGSVQRYYPQYWEARKQTLEQNKGQDTPPAKKKRSVRDNE